MLRIQRAANGDGAFTVSGQLEAGNLSELSALLAAEAADGPLVLDLHDLILVDRAAVRFLRGCERNGTVFRHCPAYIRAWMNCEGEEQ
jgi:hypothetical protein